MVLGSYYLGLCRFGFRGLCDDWGTNRVICGYGIRTYGVECVSDFDSVLGFCDDVCDVCMLKLPMENC